MKAAHIQPLNALQIELLKMFARNVDNQDLQNIKAYLAHYFANKAMDEADNAWVQKGYVSEDEQKLMNDHHRAAKNKSE